MDQKRMEALPEYIYLGDKNTDARLKGKICTAIRRNGKCIRAKNGNMLVVFDDGDRHVVIARLLRKIKKTAG
jgi:hypothetical protein